MTTTTTRQNTTSNKKPDRERPSYLVLDLETVPDTPRWTKPEHPPGTESPFPPTWAHRVIAVGCLWLDADLRLLRLGFIQGLPRHGEDLGEDQIERALLLELSEFLTKKRPILVTFNGRTFDLPVLVLRALRHGVPLPWYYQAAVQNRYRDDGHVDLCDVLANRGAARMGSLDAIARLMGLPGKSGIDGTQVEALYKTGAFDAIEHYCLEDVIQTAFVFLRLRLLQGALDPKAYTTCAANLFEALESDGRFLDLLTKFDRERILLVRPAETQRSSGPVRDDFFPYLDTGS